MAGDLVVQGLARPVGLDTGRGWSRRRFIGAAGRAGLGLALLPALTACGAPGQPATKPRKSRVLMFSPTSLGRSGLLGAFQEAMTELGYVEGDSLVLEERHAAGKFEQLPAIAAEIANAKWDVVVCSGTQASLAMKQASTTVPIVMTNSTDPVGEGLVTSLEKPGGNVTGLNYTSRDYSEKRLELLKLASPNLSRVMVLWNANNEADQAQFETARASAQRQGLEAQSLELRGTTLDLNAAFEAAASEKAQAMLVVNDPLIFARAAQLANLATQHKLLTMFDRREYLPHGGLMSYGASIPDLYRRSAYFVDRILHGTKPADLPVEPPPKFDLVLNQKTAQAIGFKFPDALVGQATDVMP